MNIKIRNACEFKELTIEHDGIKFEGQLFNEKELNEFSLNILNSVIDYLNESDKKELLNNLCDELNYSLIERT